MAESDQSLRIAVMGMPGQGKSSLLNGFVKKSTIAHLHKGKNNQLFEIAGSAASCTKNIKHQALQIITGGGKQVPVEIYDTMGWPDTDKSHAANMYDRFVMDVINNGKGLTALVWVVMQDRRQEKIWKTYKAFLTELSHARCPIILLMNGVAEKNGLDEEDFDEKDEKAAHASLKADAENMIRELGIQVFPTILTSLQKTDLTTKSPLQIIDLLQTNRMPCRVSRLLTFKEMKVAFATSESALKKHQEEVTAARAWRSAAFSPVGVSLLATGPVGWVIGAGLIASALFRAGDEPDLRKLEELRIEANKRKADVDRLKEYLEK